MSDYEATIGIECHVQFNTKSKLFSGADNDARAAEPNTVVNHIDFGLPGALPVLNERAIEKAIRAAFALNTRPQPFSKFDRKHYFYPDLPMGYQITQYDQPIILGGHVDITVDGKAKRINITRAHLEADAGKSMHPAGKEYSLVDLNRSGTPLLEIVSEPEMHSAAEAKAYARELYLRMKYAGVSDADLYHGNMRFDVNVSISSERGKLGTRTETKNLNSFRSVEKAVEYEIKRQTEQLKRGNTIHQETRGWDDAKQKTFSQRSKENADDYRYFPDPDLPPVVLDAKQIAVIEHDMPELPDSIRRKLSKIGLDGAVIESLIEEPANARRVLGDLDAHDASAARNTANWLTGALQNAVSEGSLTWERVHDESNAGVFTAVSALLGENLLSSTAAKEVLLASITEGKEPRAIAEERNLMQLSDESDLVMIVEQVITENPKAADDVRNGEMKAIGFLVGQVMKASQGKANPGVVQQMIRTKLGA
jgi:aspartyl-tRNA(Asn)/glutamyl-tRNA(Gln) amidotransferase subunit B